MASVINKTFARVGVQPMFPSMISVRPVRTLSTVADHSISEGLASSPSFCAMTEIISPSVPIEGFARGARSPEDPSYAEAPQAARSFLPPLADFSS